MELGPARQAGADIVGTVFVPLGQQIVLVPEGRPGADDRHIAHKDVPQLGQLVQAGLAQETPHPGDILVRVVEEMGGHIVGGVDPHGAEFQDVEMLFVDAHPFLLEKHRAGRIQLDGDAEHQQQGRKAEITASSRLIPFRYMEVPPFGFGCAPIITRGSTIFNSAGRISARPVPSMGCIGF